MKKRFLLLCLSLSVVCGFARGKQEVIPSDSWVYDALTALVLDEGHIALFEQTPLSVGELDALLYEVSYENLSEPGKAVYDSLMKWRAQENWGISFGLFSVSMEPFINLEGYVQTDKSLPLVYNYLYRKNLLELPVVITAGDWVSIQTTIKGGQFKCCSLWDNVYCNIPLELRQIRDMFPHEAYAGVGYSFAPGHGFNVQFGRGALSVGRSLIGSAVWSDSVTELSYLNASLYSPSFRYDFNIAQFGVCGNCIDRFYYTHRLAFRFFKKFQASFQESILVVAPLEIRYMNPLIIFHSLNTLMDPYPYVTCNVFAITASYTPIKHVRVYGVYVQDESRCWGEGNINPDARGYQFGVEAYVPVEKGYLHGWLEASYTDPFMYIKNTPAATLFHTYTEQAFGSNSFIEWGGSPLGPDTFAAQANVSYEVQDQWNVLLSYRFSALGEYANEAVFSLPEWPFPNADNYEAQTYVAPHGQVMYEHRITARAEWKPFEFLTVMAQPSFICLINQNHEVGKNAFGFEGALSVSLNLAKLWHLHVSVD